MQFENPTVVFCNIDILYFILKFTCCYTIVLDEIQHRNAHTIMQLLVIWRNMSLYPQSPQSRVCCHLQLGLKSTEERPC